MSPATTLYAMLNNIAPTPAPSITRKKKIFYYARKANIHNETGIDNEDFKL
jgi:hypothetical protein